MWVIQCRSLILWMRDLVAELLGCPPTVLELFEGLKQNPGPLFNKVLFILLFNQYKMGQDEHVGH